MAGQYDYAIVGGGFFGARLAIELARWGYQVLLLERDKDLMQRASYVNQARVHGGYHYPRSLLTALRSRVNLPVFSDEYEDCIDDQFEKYYAIARNFTKVNSEQFRMFCERIEAPIERAPQYVRELFNDDMVEDVFRVKEYAFDSSKIKQRMIREMNEAGVDWRTQSEALQVRQGPVSLILRYADTSGEHEVAADQVLNCTYARINELNRNSGLPEIPLKHEIAEICLIDPPAEIADKGVTVMCGPFFSTMPFPSRGKYSFTHVRYTPHTEWHEGMGQGDIKASDPYAFLARLELNSGYHKMLADAKRYLPCMKDAKYTESLYEVKTVLPQSEGDDSRPIMFKQDYGLPGYTCIMGGKLDNVYDVFKELSRSV